MAVQKLTFEMNAVGNAVPEMKKVQAQLGSLDQTMTRTTSRMANQNRVMRSTTGGMKRMTRNMGSLGLQVQDVAVQASMGTDALRIFSMQGGQILSIFGPLGMIAGALTGVGAAVLMASGGLDRFRGVFSDITPALDNFTNTLGVLLMQFQPLVSFVGGVLRGAFNMLGGVIDFVSDNLAALTTAAGIFVSIQLGNIALKAARNFLSLAKAISATRILMTALNAVTRKNPIMLIAIAAGVAADQLGLITKAMDELKERFPEFFQAVTDAGSATAQLITESFNALNAALRTPATLDIGGNAEDELSKITSATQNAMSALDQMKSRLKSVTDKIESSMESAFMSIVDGTMTAKDAFRAMASDIIKELYRIYVVKQITGFIADAIGLMGGPNPFAFKAIGGPVQSGKPYVVGERGPEMFVPSRSGSIVPNNKLGGGGGVVVNQVINVSTGVQQTVRAEIKQLMPQIADSAKAAVVDAKRRGGDYGRAFA
jgi:hypothetical protein